MLTILIPCLNEENTIGRAISEAKKALKRNKIKNAEIIVADNGSDDKSLGVIKRSKNVKLVTVPIRGYGAALHWGILSAKGHYIFFADADLSYDFSELPKFIKFINSKTDLVLGSRFQGKIQKRAMPFLNRYVGTPLLTLLVRLIYGIKTTDCNSGMRMIRRNFYKKLNMKNSGMEWASELLIKTALNKGRYVEVPIKFRKDKRKKPPHLLRWGDGWRHLKAIVLLKPNSLIIPILFLIFVAMVFLKNSFHLFFFFMLLAIALIFSYLAAKILNFAINDTASRLADLIQKVSIVALAIFLTILVFLLLLVLPTRYSELKIIIVSIIMIFNMWVFLIETIKTHLINRLP